jgi:hypothetical protein
MPHHTTPRPQGVPQWTCGYSLQYSGSGSPTGFGTAEVATWLAATLSAGGQEFCAGQPAASGFCSSTLGVTGLCAASPAPAGGASSFCKLTPVSSSSSWTMTASLASPGVDCPPAGKKLSAAGQSSLLALLSSYMPGFKLSLPPQATKQALSCVQQYVSALDGGEGGWSSSVAALTSWPDSTPDACCCPPL